ncbi:hypothetical protein [Burkholderia vietnamiensis]|uniref:hypothetical protein n=1 Tax=Burkholderia vietnamiensis TaxID=60552 RepID=UPI00159384F4|nr:hypothetical protein [Burkholderia vietnamiensis]MCA8074017.1 hypothetical protein [Burkholderia vietnamiensis]
MHWIIKAGERTYSTPETPGCTINLSEKLNLKPPFVSLNRVEWSYSVDKFGDPHQSDSRYEVNEALRDSHQGTNLPDRLQLTFVDRCHASQIGIQGNGNG